MSFEKIFYLQHQNLQLEKQYFYCEFKFKKQQQNIPFLSSYCSYALKRDLSKALLQRQASWSLLWKYNRMLIIQTINYLNHHPLVDRFLYLHNSQDLLVSSFHITNQDFLVFPFHTISQDFLMSSQLRHSSHYSNLMTLFSMM